MADGQGPGQCKHGKTSPARKPWKMPKAQAKLVSVEAHRHYKPVKSIVEAAVRLGIVAPVPTRETVEQAIQRAWADRANEEREPIAVAADAVLALLSAHGENRHE